MNRYIVYMLSTVAFLVMVGCGSKKKTLEVTKEERIENKDYYLKQLDSLKQEIEYRNAIIQLSIEPVDSKVPNTAKFTRTETGFEYEGENSKLGAKSQNEENKVRTEMGRDKEESDKGEVYEKKKAKNMDLEREDTSGNIKWSIFGVALILIVAYFIWKKR